MRVHPRRNLRATLEVPGDKSITHRALILGALARGTTEIRNPLPGLDCRSTLEALRLCGVAIDVSGTEGDERWMVRGRPDSWSKDHLRLDCGNSGTTMRLMMGLLAGQRFEAVLDGDNSLRTRPMERVARLLRQMGGQVETTAGTAPVHVHRTEFLHGARIEADVASAQVKSAVLLAGLGALGRTIYVERAPTRDHTETLLRAMGAPLVESQLQDGARELALEGGARLSGIEVRVPGDPSSAAFLVIAALLCENSRIEIRNAGLNPRRIGFIDVLRRMGASIESHPDTERSTFEPVGTIVASTSTLSGTLIEPHEVPSLIDEVPILAIAAATAKGHFEVRGARELRFKESDRIAHLATGLRAMGVDVHEHEDGFEFEGVDGLRGARIDAAHDHRIAMAFAVAALAARGETEIAGSDVAAVSYPRFFDQLLDLGNAR